MSNKKTVSKTPNFSNFGSDGASVLSLNKGIYTERRCCSSAHVSAKLETAIPSQEHSSLLPYVVPRVVNYFKTRNDRKEGILIICV